MGFIGSMLSPGGGSGFTAAGNDLTQQNTAYQQTQQGLNQQQQFVDALNSQGGLGNQASVFNQQQALAGQLQNVANGTGPNPAMAQLQQTTGQNVANQAALMAGQRGSSANAGLMARLAAQQGGNLQQQAVGQGATLSAQQQLAGMQQLQNQQANMANLANTQIGQQQTGLNAYNQAALQQQSNLLGLQANANNTNAGISQGNQAAQGNLLGGLMGGAAMGAMMLNKGGKVPGYAGGGAIAGNPLMQPIGQVGVVDNSGSAPLSNTGQILSQGQGPSMGAGGGSGGLGGGSKMLGQLAGQYLGKTFGSDPSLKGWGSGDLEAGGTGIQSDASAELGYAQADALGTGGEMALPAAGGAAELGGAAAGIGDIAATAAPIAAGIGEVASAAAPVVAGIGEVAAEAAPLLALANRGGRIGDKLKKGGEVPGQAQVQGDSPANDTVSAKLSPDEIVIPRSITMHPNAPELAKQFVMQTLAKGGSAKSNYDEGGVTGFQMSPEQQAAMTNYVSSPQALQQQAMVQTPQAQQAMEQRAALMQALPRAAPMPEAPNVDLGGGKMGEAPVNGAQDIYSGYNPTQGYNTQIGGIQKQAGLEGKLATKQAEMLNEQNNVLKDLTMQAQQNSFNHNVEVENVVNDMKNDKIDPDRYINNKGTGSKIASAIGLILGGMGGGLTRQENPAAKYLNDSINRDIEAQKMEMGKKQNLLSALEKQYGNQQDAVKMAHAIYSTRIENQIKEEAAKLGTPMAEARAMQAIGPLQSARNQAMMEVGLRQAAMKSMQSGNPEQSLNALRMINPAMAKEMETRLIPGVGMASIPVPEKVRADMSLRHELDQKLQALENFSTKNSGTVMDRATVNKGHAMAQDVQDAYRRANGQGVFREAESKFVENMVNQDPTAFFAKYRAMPGYEAVKSGNKTALQNLYKQVGLKPPAMPQFKAR